MEKKKKQYKYKSIKSMLENKEYDLLLSVEMEKERLFPERSAECLIGLFLLTNNLIPKNDIDTALITSKTLKENFMEFLKDKNTIVDTETPLRLCYCYNVFTYRMSKVLFYIVNRDHNLKESDIHSAD